MELEEYAAWRRFPYANALTISSPIYDIGQLIAFEMFVDKEG